MMVLTAAAMSFMIVSQSALTSGSQFGGVADSFRQKHFTITSLGFTPLDLAMLLFAREIAVLAL
jgi:hypothetical protein